MSRSVQEETCRRLGHPCVEPASTAIVGIARNVLTDLQPLNALRHPPAENSTGWYIWAGGEPSSSPDFFEPLHVEHLAAWCPRIVPYLGLPPGSRVMLADNLEDVWTDPSLLEIE